MTAPSHGNQGAELLVDVGVLAISGGLLAAEVFASDGLAVPAELVTAKIGIRAAGRILAVLGAFSLGRVDEVDSQIS